MWHDEVSDYIQYGALFIRLKQLKQSNFVYDHVYMTILCVSKGIIKKSEDGDSFWWGKSDWWDMKER